MLNENRETRQPNYPGLAAYALKHLKNRFNEYSGIGGVSHNNPVTREECERGIMVIAFSSWDKALKSQAMNISGSVSGTCTKCGWGGFVDRNKEIVNLTV